MVSQYKAVSLIIFLNSLFNIPFYQLLKLALPILIFKLNHTIQNYNNSGFKLLSSEFVNKPNYILGLLLSNNVFLSRLIMEEFINEENQLEKYNDQKIFLDQLTNFIK
jgi:hypothetical protein